MPPFPSSGSVRFVSAPYRIGPAPQVQISVPYNVASLMHHTARLQTTTATLHHNANGRFIVIDVLNNESSLVRALSVRSPAEGSRVTNAMTCISRGIFTVISTDVSSAVLDGAAYVTTALVDRG